MERDKYFLVDKLPENLVSSVSRFYNVVSSDAKKRQVFGVSKNSINVSQKILDIEIEKTLYDFETEPNFISIFSFAEYSNGSRLAGIMDGLSHREDGIYCERRYRELKGIKPRVCDLKSKLIRVGISQDTKRLFDGRSRQYAVLEFSGDQTSASKYSKILEEKLSESSKIIKSYKFCILGNNLKQTIKSNPAQ